jgi:hypothetical protein
MKWGGEWDKNTNRPYFLGHEKEENVLARQAFVDYFLDRQDLYYYPVRDRMEWNIPLRKPTILISHDESTFRSGETQLYRWIFPENAPLFNKGKGRSIMVSEFLVQHHEALFKLDEDEWKAAVKAYPELKRKEEREKKSKKKDLVQNHDFLNFYPQSASAWIEPKKDCYFNNKIILKQFERLFILLKFKKSYRNHNIEIIVDHATTHTAKHYDVNLFAKSSGSKCQYETIEWIEDDETRTSVNCKDEEGVYRGLQPIMADLGIEVSEDLSLSQMRKELMNHPAFENISRLEKLASQYGHKIVWCPKYHCELAPVEGYWCSDKQYVRKHNDQTFNKFHEFLTQARSHFLETNLNFKLWNRFWNCLQMYKDGSSYSKVLSTLFGAKSSSTVTSHKKNIVFNTKL